MSGPVSPPRVVSGFSQTQQVQDRLADALITTRIQARCFVDPVVKGRRIDVTTNTGVVTLAGDVENERERRQALALARTTEGVREVVDALTVRSEQRVGTTGRATPAAGAPPLAQPARGAAEKRNSRAEDAMITARVQAQFLGHPDVRARSIDVTTTNGIVRLTGEVANQREQREAVEIARETNGVKQVIDKLRVRQEAVATSGRSPGASGSAGTGAPPVPTGTSGRSTQTELSDRWITTKIQAACFLDADVKGRHVEVSTMNRDVTLTGAVTTGRERTQAVAIARTTDGVREVIDKLTVQAGVGGTDPAPGIGQSGGRAGDVPSRLTRADAIRLTQIKTKLALDPEVSALAIDVAVSDGVVTLTGTVQSESARARALAIARGVEGVKQVVDELVVKQGSPRP